MKDTKKILKIYYDGTCPMCTVFKERSEKHTDRAEVEFFDVHTAEVPESIRDKDLLSEMYAISSDGTIISGSESVFAVLSKHESLSWLARIGKLPIIRQCARPTYRLIAAQRQFIFGQNSRIFWIRIVTTIGLLLGLVISLPLWIGERVVPLAPVFSFVVPDSVSAVLFVGLVLSLLWGLLSPKPKIALFLSAGLMGSLAVLDQNRFQPWFYQYGAILLLLATFSWSPKDLAGQFKILNVLRLLLASIYIYSGIQKINPVFYNSTFPWMLEPILGPEYIAVVLLIGLLVPFVEIFIGAGLLFKRTRFWALGGVLLMLLFVLITLGPLGNDWNMVVWPWNIVFAILAFLLFWRFDKTATEIIVVPRTVISFAVLALFVFCPILFFFDKWDSYPSFSLYSGQVPELVIQVPSGFLVPEELKSYIMQGSAGSLFINSTKLAMDDIRVPIYPETRVHQTVARKICDMLSNDARVVIKFIPKSHWRKNKALPEYGCGQL